MDRSIQQLVADIQAGGPSANRAAGRLMTLLENHPEALPELLQAAGPDSPEPRLLLGITGAPGCGKSTLTDAMVSVYRERSQRVGVIAVDPSSPFSGGAVLGDRVRMMRHATDPMVFVRSVASRGHLGGLALGIRGVLRVMGLMGMEVVIIETVGVGQSEVEVVRVADEVAVVLAPGQGDSVQLLKAGLMEIGDFIVINKSDRDGAQELHAQVLSALQVEDRTRHVALVSALERNCIGELVDAIEARAQGRSAERAERRAAGCLNDIREAVLESARNQMLHLLEHDSEMRTALEQVTNGGNATSVLRALLGRAAKL